MFLNTLSHNTEIMADDADHSLPTRSKPGKQTDWQFINISKPTEARSSDFRRTVRENAARDSARSQRTNQTEAFLKGKATTEAKKQISVFDQSTSPRPEEMWMSGGIISGENFIDTGNDQPWKYQEYNIQLRNASKTQELPPNLVSEDTNTKSASSRSSYMYHSSEDYSKSNSSTRSYPSSPQTYLGASRIDPFGAGPYGIYKSPSCNLLIDHFATVLAPALIPIYNGETAHPLGQTFLQAAMSDPMLYYATLAVSAVHKDVLYGTRFSQISLSYRGEAIRLVNKSIGSGTPITDSMIATVALLAGSENLTGNTTELVFHMDALEKMVRMRGGPDALGMQGVLYMFVFCQDLLSATITQSKPRFEPSQCVEIVAASTRLLQKYITSIACTEVDAGSASVPSQCEQRQDMIKIFEDLKILSRILRSTNRFSAIEVMSFSSLRSSVEYRLLCLSKECPYHDEMARECIYESCRIAALIYTNYVMRQFHPNFTLLKVLKQLLMEELGRKDWAKLMTTNQVELSSGALLWILCTGAVLSLNKKDLEWFAFRIAAVMFKMGLETWQESEQALKKRFLWVRKMSDFANTFLRARVQGHLREQSKSNATP